MVSFLFTVARLTGWSWLEATFPSEFQAPRERLIAHRISILRQNQGGLSWDFWRRHHVCGGLSSGAGLGQDQADLKQSVSTALARFD